MEHNLFEVRFILYFVVKFVAWDLYVQGGSMLTLLEVSDREWYDSKEIIQRRRQWLNKLYNLELLWQNQNFISIYL